jgi:multiple sugar transport system substrate-binding protein
MIDQPKQTVSRRKMLKMISTSLAAAALAACAPAATQTQQPDTGSQTGSATLPPEPSTNTVANIETGTLTCLMCCGTDDTRELQQRFNEYFSEKYPSVKTALEFPPAGQNYFEKLQTLFAAGTPPDVFDMWEGYVQPYAANGALLDMTPYIMASDWKMDDFQPAAVEAVSYEGKIYSIVRDFYHGPSMLFYNKALFDAAGEEYPSFDWDWNRMREAAQRLTKGEGQTKQYGLVFETWFVPWLYFIWSNGGNLFNEDSTECMLTEAQATEAIQFWADMITKDEIALPSAEQAAMQGALNAFKTGQVAMFLGFAWNIEEMRAAREQGLDWGSVLPPKANNGGRSFYMHLETWAIAKPTKVPNAAWQYVYDFTEEFTDDFIQFFPGIPMLKKDSDLFLTEDTIALGWDRLPEVIADPNNIRIPGAGEKFDKISGIVQAELDLVFTGEKTAQAAAEVICPKVNEELSRGTTSIGDCRACTS